LSHDVQLVLLGEAKSLVRLSGVNLAETAARLEDVCFCAM